MKSKYMSAEAQQSAVDNISRLWRKMATGEKLVYPDSFDIIHYLQDYAEWLVRDGRERFCK